MAETDDRKPLEEWRDMRREIVSRVEIIDENGRAYSRRELFIDLISLQDDGHTLKLFLRHRKGTREVDALQRELAEARKERDEAIVEKTRALIRGTVKGFTAGENANAKHWRKRAEEAERDRDEALALTGGYEGCGPATLRDLASDYLARGFRVVEAEGALRAIADDDGTWSDGNGIRDSGPGFDRLRDIARAALSSRPSAEIGTRKETP